MTTHYAFPNAKTNEMEYILSLKGLPLPQRSSAFSRKVLIVIGISTASLLFASLFLLRVHAQLAPVAFNASSGSDVPSHTVFLSAAGAAAAEKDTHSISAPLQELHIAANGLVLLRGATVVSVSNHTIRASLTWGPDDFVWLVQTDYSTKFIDPKGERGSLSDIRPGASITVTGMLTGGGTEPTINANFVRE